MPKKSCQKKVVEPDPYPQPVLKPFCINEFRKQCLDAHNNYRALHCCPPLKMCPEMNAFAMEWVQNLVRKKRIESRHYENFGENMYLAENIDVSGDLPVKRWYDEIGHYEFATSKYSPCISHFTQVIWKNSQKIGIGVMRDGNTTYVVVNYYPRGNIQGQFAEMVPRRTQKQALQ